MKTRDELIEVMAEAYFNSTFPDEKWNKIFEETRAAFRISIEAAFNALIAELPKIIITGNETYISEIQDKEEQIIDIYNDLLEMGK